MADNQVMLQGIAASPGVCVGPIVRFNKVEVSLENAEAADLAPAIGKVAERLEGLSASARDRGQDEAGDVLYAQSQMAGDPMLADSIQEQLDAGLPLSEALDVAGAGLEALLASLPDPYLAARAADVGEVVDALRRELAGVAGDVIDLTEPSVLFAEELTAAETANLDVELVLGFATATGGATSHVSIIARSLGLPAVVGVGSALTTSGAVAALDGQSGVITLDPTAETIAAIESRAKELAERDERTAALRGQRVSFAGRDMKVSANVGNVDDTQRAQDEQADGVGLFRTEFLFLDRAQPPSEQAQLDAYLAVAAGWEHPVVLRTFDIGGDKPADYLTFEDEENPFLGTRGVRVYEHEGELFASQVRAALRAAAGTQIAIMIPMVATVHEFKQTRATIEAIGAELDVAGIERGHPKIGVMVEVPSAAVSADLLAAEADFLSIGTNDLTQYTYAADRTLSALSHLQDPLQPGLLRLVKMVADAGRSADIETSVCGLAAADPVAAVIFATLGIDKLSVAAASVNLIKATLHVQEDSLPLVIHEAIAASTSAGEIRSAVEAAMIQP